MSTVLACTALFGGLLVRRRFPLIAVAVLPASLLFIPSTEMMVVSYTVASRKGLRWHTAVAVAVGAVVLAFWSPRGEDFSWGMWGATLGLFSVLPMFLGLWVFQRRALLVALRERAEQAERERDLRAERVVVAERRRIAREMHDVVAHRVSAIALQSGALTMTAPDEHTEQVAEVIRKTSTTALTELREILQVLREEQSGEPGHVVPSLTAVPALVADAVATGLQVTTDLPEPVPEVPAAAGRAAYRVVQESLTNAAKHAPGAPVEVVVRVGADDLVVEVTNPQRPGAPGVPGSGFGLVGMRERVSLAGGELETGWLGEIFRVRAVLPLKAAE